MYGIYGVKSESISYSQKNDTFNYYDCCGQGLEPDDSGNMYCPVCGSQSQDIVSTVLQTDFVFSSTGYGKSLAAADNSQSFKSTPKSEHVELKVVKEEVNPYSFIDDVSVPADFGKVKQSPEEFAVIIRLRYIHGIQVMIQLQCEALVGKFSINPMICGLAGTIWLKFVAASGVFADGWVNDVITESEVQFQDNRTDKEVAEKLQKIDGRAATTEPCNLYGQRAAVIWFRSLRRKIPRESSLAICFLACHIAREQTLPTDLTTWALEGKLPYMTAFVDIEKCLGSPATCPFSSRFMFRPPRIITSARIESLAGTIAENIGLQLPPVNFYVIAYRFLNQLCLPTEKILPHALSIYEWSMPTDLWLSANPNKLPTRICIMSILIVAIRILYNIHGFGIWETSFSNAIASCKIALDTSTSGYNTSELLCHLENIYNDLDDKPEYLKSVEAYLEYCKNVIFRGLNTSYEEDNIAEQLWNFYKSEEDIKKPVVTDAECIGLNKKRSRDEAFIGEITDDCVLEKSRKTKTEVCDGVSLSNDDCNENEGSAEKRLHGEPSTSSNGEDPLPEDIRLVKLKSDMEENNFLYVRPRSIYSTSSRKDGYLYYKRVKAGGMLHYAAHADYYILLRACAKVVQVDARTLHAATLKLERSLSRIEESMESRLKMMKLQKSSGSVNVFDNDERVTNTRSSFPQNPDGIGVIDDDDTLDFSKINFSMKL